MNHMMELEWNYLAIVAITIFLLSCYMGYRRGFIKEAVSTFFVVLALVMVWKMNPYVNQFLTNHTPVYQAVQEKCKDGISEYLLEADTEESQGKLIAELPLPSYLKEGIIENNNSEVYQFLAVDTFSDYIANYLARIILNGISFLVSYFVSNAVIRMLIYALDLISRLPVLRGINRLAGILVGGIRGLLLIWILFLVITLCWNTEWGKVCIRMIEENEILSYLYEKDIFVDIFMSIFYGK